MCQRSECNAAALIIFQLILTYVPQTDCVAFTAPLDQMFHFAGVTSNSASDQSCDDVKGWKSDCANLNKENERNQETKR